MNWINGIKKVPQQIKYSQNGEEYWLKYIFDNIGTTNKYLVDLGAWDGIHLSNTKLLIDSGWTGLLVDGKDYPGVYNSFITVENINTILTKRNVPKEPDLLSIDLDGNDFWILNEVLQYLKPRLIISEFNSEIAGSKTIKYNPDFVFWPCDYYGYTFEAGVKLADKHGYTIIFQNSNLNLYYLRNDLVLEGFKHIDNPGYYKHWGANPNTTFKQEWTEI
jgi:hypothetical protein